MKKDLKQKNCIELEFIINPFQKNLYQLSKSSTEFNKFKCFFIEKAININHIKKEYSYICESWDNGVKILHIGLIQINENIYIAELIDNTNVRIKNSLIFFCIHSDLKAITLYYFANFREKDIESRIDFFNNYLKTINL